MATALKKHIEVISKVFRKTFSNYRYWVLTLVVFIPIILLAIWLPNLSLIIDTAFSASMNLSEKLNFLVATLSALRTNFTVASRTITILVTALFALNVSLVVRYVRVKRKLGGFSGSSIGGMLTGLLGMGCAACGSVILSSIFGVSATAGFIGALPFGGQEFGVVAMGVLGYSILSTSKKINSSGVCHPDNQN